MAKYLNFEHRVEIPAEALRKKVEAAPFENAAAVLKAYQLLDTLEKHGILDMLRGAISAENTIIDKVAGYANTPEGINTMRNLMVLGKLVGSLNPDVLKDGTHDLTASVVREVQKPAPGLFGILRRLFRGDLLRGIAISMAALESIGKTARDKSEKLGAGK